MKIKVKEFDPEKALIFADDEKRPWFFTCAMVGTCAPVFDYCWDNYEVAKKLTQAGVIDEACLEDSEASQMFVYFKTREGGEEFIRRLNDYIKEKFKRLKEANDF